MTKRQQEIARVLQAEIVRDGYTSRSGVTGLPYYKVTASAIAERLVPVVERMVKAAIVEAEVHHGLYKPFVMSEAWRAALAAAEGNTP